MSLYHKYRPDSLKQVKGNEAIVSSLENMLSNPEKCSKVFLLHGPTGCGKTTIGRIIKKRLGVSDADYQEIDSADFRGIDTIRELRKNSGFKPISSPYRMYLLDECHKLTNDAQNALLKILEDTPEHLFFILCTTEPDKIIKAVQGRCTMLKVEQLSETQMKGLLKRVAREEGETLSKEVLDQIVLDANGHPRNALQILEQVLNTEEEKRLEVAQYTAQQQTESIALCRALLGKSSWKEVSSILEGLKQQDAERIRRHVLGYAQSVLLKTDNPKAGLVLEEFIQPFYDSGFPHLVYACYSVVKNS